MSFLDSFESSRDGADDTIEFVIRVAIVTLAAVVLVVILALVTGLFAPNGTVNSKAILEIVNPAFQTVIGAFVGLLGGLSLNANARDKDRPALDAPQLNPAPALDDPSDDDVAPWERYRHDLRWDTNGDGVVDQTDFPDWRNAG